MILRVRATGVSDPPSGGFRNRRSSFKSLQESTVLFVEALVLIGLELGFRYIGINQSKYVSYSFSIRVKFSSPLEIDLIDK